MTAGPDQQGQAEAFRRDGFLRLPAMVDPELCHRAVKELQPWFNPALSAVPDRLTNAAWNLAAVRDLADLATIKSLLRFLYGREPFAFQTLNFARGTEQDEHRDDIHFDSLPAGFMCGAWVALEAVGPGQGPVTYRPGSHLFRHGEGVLDPEPVAFTADVGDVLLWSAGLLHGGAPIVDSNSTRWSQVTHYFFEGCVWYTPMHSDLDHGLLQLRQPMIGCADGVVHKPQLFGEPARFGHRSARLSSLVAPGSRGPAPIARLLNARHRLGPSLSHRLRPRLARLKHRATSG